MVLVNLMKSMIILSPRTATKICRIMGEPKETVSVTSQPVSIISNCLAEFIIIVLTRGSKKLTNMVRRIERLSNPRKIKMQLRKFLNMFLLVKRHMINNSDGMITTGPISIKVAMAL